MTDREKAIVMAYTGICMLTDDKLQIFHKYVEEIMGGPVWTHEIGWLEIKEKSKADFIALCADESCSDFPNKWIGAEVLDKIKTEIETDLSHFCFDEWGNENPTWKEIKAIIDKYKAESEVQE